VPQLKNGDLFPRLQPRTVGGGTLTLPDVFLCIAGGADELSPVGNAIRLFDTLAGPRRLVIYEESRHSVGGGVSSALLAPNATDLSANWIAARFAGLPFPTERWFVSNAGTIATSQL
jgi:hypothetical protein